MCSCAFVYGLVCVRMCVHLLCRFAYDRACLCKFAYGCVWLRMVLYVCIVVCACLIRVLLCILGSLCA